MPLQFWFEFASTYSYPAASRIERLASAVGAPVDAVHRACVMSGTRIALDIGDRYYGLRDFIIEDPKGYRLRFASTRSS